jgi:hypothetical protein
MEEKIGTPRTSLEPHSPALRLRIECYAIVNLARVASFSTREGSGISMELYNFYNYWGSATPGLVLLLLHNSSVPGNRLWKAISDPNSNDHLVCAGAARPDRV